MTPVVRPSQIGPWALSLLASAQSSISASRIASMPPARQCLGSDQHTPAGGCCGRAVTPIDPGERVEHLEEEDEGRNEETLREAGAVEFDHQ